MVEQLHRLIDTGAPQAVVNERIAALLESARKDIEKIGSDHEKRLRYIERTIAYALGACGVIGAIVGLTLTLLKYIGK